MSLPTGAISIGNINTELGTTGARSLGQEDGRGLAGVPTGAISLSDYHGKSAIEEVLFNVRSRFNRYDRNQTAYDSETVIINNAISVEILTNVCRYIRNNVDDRSPTNRPSYGILEHRINDGEWVQYRTADISVMNLPNSINDAGHDYPFDTGILVEAEVASTIEIRYGYHTGEGDNGNRNACMIHGDNGNNGADINFKAFVTATKGGHDGLLKRVR